VSRGGLASWLVDPEPPGLGIDLRANEIAIARLSDKRKTPEIDLCFTSPLAPGQLRFTMHEPNVLDEEGFQKSLESALLRAGVAGRKRIALTLPDYVSRLSVTELPDPPRSRVELAEMLKFRLKKSLPFDTAEARLAFERLPGDTPTFLTGVMREAVVRQYEDILTGLGFQVGLVLPSSVSVLQLLRPVARRELAPGADYFFVNVEREYFSVSLVRDREVPVLLRTLGLRSTSGEAPRFDEQDLLQELIPTAIYYREKLAGGSLERVYYRSLRPDLTHLRELLEDQFEAPTEPFNLMKSIAVAKDVGMDAAVADSVAAAAGAALGKAA
jgi:type IV pilus assembly protein PilM